MYTCTHTVYIFSAEDWNLANPLKTCSLLVEQHGDKLHILFRHLQNPDDPSSITLFAQTKIDLTKTIDNNNNKGTTKKQLSMEYFVEDVVDSSRYFVVRIIDERSGREARIGFGFRDREEATDFRESLNYFVKSLKREEEAAEAIHHAEDLAANLSLQEGEKIHINLGNKGGSKSTISKTPDKDKKKSDGSGPFLLKKPPPAPVLNKDVSISFGEIDLNAGARAVDASSTAALGEISSADDDEDEWQDFEDGKAATPQSTSGDDK